MRWTIIKLTIGLVLAGCTINSTYVTVDHNGPTVSLDAVVPTSTSPTVAKENSVVTESPPIVEKTPPPCKPYVPLPVPEPVKIDLAKLKAAKSSLELNSLLLKNMKTLHNQLTNYGKQSNKHYKEYMQKCASK